PGVVGVDANQLAPATVVPTAGADIEPPLERMHADDGGDIAASSSSSRDDRSERIVATPISLAEVGPVHTVAVGGVGGPDVELGIEDLNLEHAQSRHLTETPVYGIELHQHPVASQAVTGDREDMRPDLNDRTESHRVIDHGQGGF